VKTDGAFDSDRISKNIDFKRVQSLQQQQQQQQKQASVAATFIQTRLPADVHNYFLSNGVVSKRYAKHLCYRLTPLKHCVLLMK